MARSAAGNNNGTLSEIINALQVKEKAERRERLVYILAKAGQRTVPAKDRAMYAKFFEEYGPDRDNNVRFQPPSVPDTFPKNVRVVFAISAKDVYPTNRDEQEKAMGGAKTMTCQQACKELNALHYRLPSASALHFQKEYLERTKPEGSSANEYLTSLLCQKIREAFAEKPSMARLVVIEEFITTTNGLSDWLKFGPKPTAVLYFESCGTVEEFKGIVKKDRKMFDTDEREVYDRVREEQKWKKTIMHDIKELTDPLARVIVDLDVDDENRLAATKVLLRKVLERDGKESCKDIDAVPYRQRIF